MKKIIFIFGISVVFLFVILFQKEIVSHKEVGNSLENNCIVLTVSSCYEYDVTDINKLYINADLVLVGTVDEKFPAEKKKTQMIAYTPGKLKVDTIIKGDLNQETVRFLIEGGTITLSEYESSFINVNPDIFKKEGMDVLDKRMKDNTYICYNPEFPMNFDKGKRYIMFLNKIGDTNDYAVISYMGLIPVNNSKKVSSFDDILSLLDI